jgi:hypothetical protein
MSSTTDPARRSRVVVALGVLVAAVVLLAACGGSQRTAPPTTTTRSHATTATTTQRSAVTTSSPCGRVLIPPHWQHVIVVIFENHRHGDVINNRAAPYATELARECGTATNYSDAGSMYPSLPNYIGLTSGQDGKDVGITDDCDAGAPPDKACTTSVDNIFRQARKTGVSVKSYQEDMPGNCHIGEGGGYREHHNPAVYYRGDGGGDWSDCQKNDVPMGSLSGGGNLFDDLERDTLPNIAFVEPNNCHNTHDCQVAQGDAWAAKFFPRIFASKAYRDGRTTVLWLWDEDTPIPNVIVSPATRPGTVSADSISHYSALRAIEEIFGLPLLGKAKGARDMRPLFNL